ncbi:hypothetical protein RND71_024563 [Anisodus tanguticus]|uniref:SMP domain-containing protein n=1 Tax=Anisodus tanguticus TaxID=243964 RepID=A0AAE1RRF9_9SOLA|nr:hypothetical protein RND71_024563 [Anisodus tanguticus]
MSQGKPQKPETKQQEPLKYGDVFTVTGELADQPIAPQDAAMMQSAETMVFGQSQKGGPASVMQAAATKNERAGLVGHDDTTKVAGDEGVTVAETKVPGRRIITESVAGQPVPVTTAAVGGIDVEEAPITIGKALAATTYTAGEKSVEQSDTSAIQAAEVRATGFSVIIHEGLADTAQSAASTNEGVQLQNYRLIGQRKQDAEGVMEAKLRNNPNLTTYPGGVAAAARLSERSS